MGKTKIQIGIENIFVVPTANILGTPDSTLILSIQQFHVNVTFFLLE